LPPERGAEHGRPKVVLASQTQPFTPSIFPQMQSSAAFRSKPLRATYISSFFNLLFWAATNIPALRCSAEELKAFKLGHCAIRRAVDACLVRAEEI
jgi:hypothetical protein